MLPRTSRLCSLVAIFSLLLSGALTLTHRHEAGCCCSNHANAQAAIEGLEILPKGDCGCSQCQTPERGGQREHDHETCLICRMVYEHAVQPLNFEVANSAEPTFESVAVIYSYHFHHLEAQILTRGPPRGSFV